jgi:hypothetical protein
MGVQGVESGTPQAEKAIRYLTKYITKSVDECHQRTTAREIEHHRRFFEALRFEPCCDECPNWLRYGIQPKNARKGMQAGRCKRRVHQPATLGLGGRRILVSRDWSGKTLKDHKADQATWVRKVLAIGLDHTTPHGQDQGADDQAQPVESGAVVPALHGDDQGHELAGTSFGNDGDDSDGWDDEVEEDEHGLPVLPIQVQRHGDQGEDAGTPLRAAPTWERLAPNDPAVKPLHMRLYRSVGERIRQRAEWQAKLALLKAAEGGPPGSTNLSAIVVRRGEAA